LGAMFDAEWHHLRIGGMSGDALGTDRHATWVAEDEAAVVLGRELLRSRGADLESGRARQLSPAQARCRHEAWVIDQPRVLARRDDGEAHRWSSPDGQR
jgi:hypothetical protein